MKTMVQGLLALCSLTVTVFAQEEVDTSRILEAERAMKESASLAGKLLTVHGIVEKLDKDGMSANTFIIVLEGGLRCRISRDVFQRKQTTLREKNKSFVFNTARLDGLRIENEGMQILPPGTDVIIRGTLKKEMSRVILDRGVIQGCRDSAVRKALEIQCEGPCTRSGFYYGRCDICRDLK